MYELGGVRLLLGLTACLVLDGRSAAQGFFLPGFDHELQAQVPPTANGTVVNDYLLPFQGAGSAMPPSPPLLGSTVTPNSALPANGNFYWGQGITSQQRRSFSAIHMALIPKGPHQGRVLVWGAWFPVLVTPATALTTVPGQQWFCQAWSILDPVDPTQRFRNYLLPLASTNTVVSPPNQPVEVIDYFCAGHAWTQHGDLVVAGGGSADMDLTTVPPTATHLVPGGAKFLFLFDPSAASQPFPVPPAGPLYANEFGHWYRHSDMVMDRFYPTVTLSQQITRGSLNNSEVVIIAGGSRRDPALPANPDPNQVPGRTYESYAVGQIAPGVAPFANDPDPNPFSIILGPDWLGSEIFDEYPRLHLVRNNTIFRSGPGPHDATVNLATATQPVNVPIFGFTTLPERAWAVSSSSLPNSPWPFERDDGASLLACFPAADVVVRLGGAKPNPNPGPPIPTDSAEMFVFGPGGATVDWQPLAVPAGTSAAIPGTGGRQYVNAVMLPDASIFVVGGGTAADDQPGQPYVPAQYELKTATYSPSKGWLVGPASPTRRHYHATAVLLPDATVLIGGGELETKYQAGEHDYDIYVPHYLKGNPTRPTFVDLRDSSGALVLVSAVATARELNRGPNYGIRYNNIGPMDSIAKIVLIAPGAITHHSDMSARFVELDMGLVNGANNDAWFTIPNDGRVPRGYYMLFALNSAGVPSVALWIKVLQ